MIQWHPLFAKLLRPLVEAHYEVKTDLPVGDLPRKADVVLLRRTSAGPLPFHGLWRDLTTWNVLEFKGATVSARLRDLDLLVEVGLGIDRRLNGEQAERRLPQLGMEEVTFWYLANKLGRRFLRGAEKRLGPLEPRGEGVWRCWVLGRRLYLVSSAALPVDYDSVPLHLVAKEAPAAELAMARFVVGDATLWRHYHPWLLTLHPEIWKEVRAMVRTGGKKYTIDLRPAIDELGLPTVIEQVGLKRVLEEVGPRRVLDELGPRRVLDELGLDELLANLTPDQVRELKRRLQ